MFGFLYRVVRFCHDLIDVWSCEVLPFGQALRSDHHVVAGRLMDGPRTW